MDRKEFRDLASPGEVRETIDSLALAGGIDRAPIAEASGRVLVSRVDVGLDVPGFDRASLDGYALRARDTFGASEADPADLAVVGEVHTGEEPAVEIGAGEAVEISTGAVMPPGADAMVPVERTDPGEGRVLVRTAVAPGDNVMVAGADVAAGDRALGPGTRLSAREIGLLSAIGESEVPVRAPPRVGIVSTGDELVRPGDDVDSERGEIYDVNSYTIAAGVSEAGGDPVLSRHAGDDLEELEEVLREAAGECDLVLSSGSTSASAVDVVYRVIEEEGELLLHGAAIKPGKPMLVGELGGAAYIGLPGYPVSAMTIFRVFVAPKIREAAGLPEPATATVEGRMAIEERSEEGRLRLVSVGLVADGDGELLVYPVDKGSGATTSLADADGVVRVASETAYLAAGEGVTVELFSPSTRPPTVFGVGEADPTWNRLLDRLEEPRYLAVGSRPARRRFREGVPDVAVLGEGDAPEADGDRLATWEREWGLVVPPGNPAKIEGLGDLVDRDLRLATRSTDSSLRTVLDDRIETLADERRSDPREVRGSIAGYGLGLTGVESPARRVLAGEADAGLGLADTAARLDCGFRSLGRERLSLLANHDRRAKSGMEDLERAIRGSDLPIEPS